MGDLAGTEGQCILPQGSAAGVDGADGEPGAGGDSVGLEVEPQGIPPEGERRARVRHQFRQLGQRRPPRAVIVRNRVPDPLPREGRYRVQVLVAGDVRAVAVAHDHADAIHAGADRDELLKDDALVPAQGLLEGADAHGLIAGDEARNAAVGAEANLDVVLSDELVPVPAEGERRVGEREGAQGERGIGRGGAEVADGAHEGQRRAADEEPHGAIDGAGIEQLSDVDPGRRAVRRADPLPRAARDGTGGAQRPHGSTSCHLLTLEGAR